MKRFYFQLLVNSHNYNASTKIFELKSRYFSLPESYQSSTLNDKKLTFMTLWKSSTRLFIKLSTTLIL